MGVLYTIGYTAFPSINQFVDTIRKYCISVVIDVRSSPYSKYYLDYNKDNLEEVLASNKIHYRNYAVEFGARQQQCVSFLNNQGFFDFDLYTKKSNVFSTGAEKVIKSLSENYNMVLMCAEKDPINCHRCIMLSKYFFNRGVNVQHILVGDKVVNQKDIEKRLVDIYFPNRYQMNIFELDSSTSEGEYVDKAYHLKNKEIAYRVEDDGNE